MRRLVQNRERRVENRDCFRLHTTKSHFDRRETGVSLDGRHFRNNGININESILFFDLLIKCRLEKTFNNYKQTTHKRHIKLKFNIFVFLKNKVSDVERYVA